MKLFLKGTKCETAKCPQKALSVREHPMFKVLGDCRWSSDLILSTWKMAETGDRKSVV
jgi:hypothetical protein